MINRFGTATPCTALDQPAATITTMARAGTTVAEALDAAVKRAPRVPIPLPERVWVPPVVSVEHGRALNWIRIAIRWAAYDGDKERMDVMVNGMAACTTWDEGAFLRLLREAGFFSRKRLTAVAYITGQDWARIPGDAPIAIDEPKAA